MVVKEITKSKVKKVFLMMSLIFIFQISITYRTFAVEATTNLSNIDAVFALDASESMKTSDPKVLRIDAIKMFVDMCHVQGDRVGLSAYSDIIVKDAQLTPLNSAVDKQNFKNMITNIKLGAWTDIGLGLKRAVDILDQTHDAAKAPMIILLSDGKNDPKGDKKLSESYLNAAIALAKSKSYPVYTIGLNADGSVDKAQLEFISKETSAKNYSTDSAEGLTEILKDIFIDSTKLTELEDKSITGNGAYQDVPINIPESKIAEANISILSTNNVDVKLIDPSGKEQILPSNNIFINKTKNYSVIKLINPIKGDWILKIKGVTGDKINTSLVTNFDLKVIMNLKSDQVVHKGENLKISTYLTNNDVKIEEVDIYKATKGKLIIKGLSDNSVKEINLAFVNNALEADYLLEGEGKYEFQVKVDVGGLLKETAPITLSTTNRIPLKVGSPEKMKLSPSKIEEIINLSQYFEDKDGNNLVYTITNGAADFIKLSIQGDKLNIMPINKGTTTVAINADDGNGGNTSQAIEIQVYSKFSKFISQSYIFIILFIVIIISIVLIIQTQMKLRKYK